MKIVLATAALFVAFGLDVNAKCQNSAPSSAAYKSAMKSGDKTVSVKWIKTNLVGRKVDFGKIGSENYIADGSYFYKTRDAKFTPKGYKFYNNGMRCLDYANGPSYDKYVVNDGKLFLINGVGERIQAKLRKLK